MNSTDRWRVISALLLVGCMGLVYRVVDLGVTQTYMRASEEASNKHSRILVGLIMREWRGMPEDQVMSRLRGYVQEQKLDSLVLKRDRAGGNITLEGIQFNFQNGKLASANYGQ